ncbi:MAG: hypothetical protein DCC68_15445 [Planctomycetota bacterium]|nr:MAG: hypothetical protein DCC68_15445 [Planctomycetota bacterium]
MLVLSRRVGESIQIGSNIVITVCENAGGRIRVGIACPREIPIRRSELPAFDNWPTDDAAGVNRGLRFTDPDVD